MGYSQTLFPFFFDFNDILHDRDQKKRKTMYYGKCPQISKKRPDNSVKNAKNKLYLTSIL